MNDVGTQSEPKAARHREARVGCLTIFLTVTGQGRTVGKNCIAEARSGSALEQAASLQ